jgi:hypothetical protein
MLLIVNRLVDVAFNVVQIPAGQGRKFPRPGICTGWLNDLVKKVSNGDNPKVKLLSLEIDESSLTIADP